MAHDTFTLNVTVVLRHEQRLCPWQTPWYQPWQLMEVRGNCHGSFRGHPWPLPRQCDNHHGRPRKSAAISTAVSADFQTELVPRQSAAVRGHWHGKYPRRDKYHGRPRKSAAIATAVSAHFGCSRGCFRRSVRGSSWVCPRVFPADVSVGVRGCFRGYVRGSGLACP